jgi:anti-anti-sigma factor
MSECTTYHWRVVPVGDGVIVTLLGHPPWWARWELDERNNFVGFPALDSSRPAKVFLDCSSLEHLGSAGHGALLKLVRTMRTWGGRLVLCRVRPLVAEALAVARLADSKLFDMHPDSSPITLPSALDPSWLSRNNGAVLELATRYRAKSFCSSLADLADALEAAGCTDADILAHCRGPDPHVHGCWVLDLLLGKA